MMKKLIRAAWRRVVTRYNVENRADKVLSRKPTAAPKHNPELEKSVAAKANVHSRDDQLLNRLGQINLERGGDPDLPKTVGKRDKLPQRPEVRVARGPVNSEEDIDSFGVFAKQNAAAGKVNLKMLLSLLNDVNAVQVREKWPRIDDEKRKQVGEELASRYKLEASQIATLIQYLGLFMVHIPESQKQHVQVEPAKLSNAPVSQSLQTEAALKHATRNLPPNTRLASKNNDAANEQRNS